MKKLNKVVLIVVLIAALALLLAACGGQSAPTKAPAEEKPAASRNNFRFPDIFSLYVAIISPIPAIKRSIQGIKIRGTASCPILSRKSISNITRIDRAIDALKKNLDAKTLVFFVFIDLSLLRISLY